MTEDELFAAIDPALRSAGALPFDGEEFRTPPLDVLRYYARPTRLHWLPLVGRALGVVAVARQPVDLPFDPAGCRQLLARLSLAANGRFPPWGGFQGGPRGLGGAALGLTAVVLTPEPVGPGDEAVLQEAVGDRARPRGRAVPLGLLRVNLGQQALAFALTATPEGAFPEPAALADVLSQNLGRFLPILET